MGYQISLGINRLRRLHHRRLLDAKIPLRILPQEDSISPQEPSRYLPTLLHSIPSHLVGEMRQIHHEECLHLSCSLQYILLQSGLERFLPHPQECRKIRLVAHYRFYSKLVRCVVAAIGDLVARIVGTIGGVATVDVIEIIKVF